MTTTSIILHAVVALLVLIFAILTILGAAMLVRSIKEGDRYSAVILTIPIIMSLCAFLLVGLGFTKIPWNL